jgi:hypothetical protein
MDTSSHEYEIEVGVVPRGGVPDAPYWWCMVSRQGQAVVQLSTELTSAPVRQALWQALRCGLRTVPDGATARIVVDGHQVALVRHLLHLMLGDQPRVRTEVHPRPGTEPIRHLAVTAS